MKPLRSPFHWRLLCMALLFATVSAALNALDARWTTQPWNASWIVPPIVNGAEYGVFHFRKDFTLTAQPGQFRVHVSADNRYRLYVNGTSAGVGPARGDLAHWRFDTYDLAHLLKPGKNTLAAVVWNAGEERPVAQMTARTGFILQGDVETASLVDTDASWKVRRDSGYTPVPIDHAALQTYLVVGPGDRIDGSKHLWDWQTSPLSDETWQNARTLERGFPHGTGTGAYWQLVPRTVPMPEELPERFDVVRRSSRSTPPDGWLGGASPWAVPANSEATVLIDRGHLSTGYPELEVSGGKGSEITLTYAEALFDAKREKGNRNEIEGKTVIGVHDTFIADGQPNRVFSPLWYRTYRYIELKVKTGAEPLEVRDLRARFTAYPFRENGSFTSADPLHSKLWEIGWRTARLCAFETYMDCPYYEQLQYVGDTRIQALISLYVSGDDRLVRNAIQQYNDSRIPEGLTQSRYPSNMTQVINTFSLFWVDMVHDYWRHRDDMAFVAQQMPGVTSVLHWFETRLDSRTGLLGPLQYWTFVDWPDEWAWDTKINSGGVPSGAVEGGSAIVTLQYAITLGHAADLYSASGMPREAARCREQKAMLIEAVRRTCWDPERRYFSDTPARTVFSQHVNTFAVLAGAVQGSEARDLIERAAADKTLIQATLYFRFYLLRAMRAAGLGDRYLEELGAWKQMIDAGLTTFAEKNDPTRSDCHAWSASPNYELLATVCGIEPASPGFRSVRIAPNPGRLTQFHGKVPHPKGLIELQLVREGTHGSATVILPVGLSGEFVWEGKSHPLREGSQTLTW
ncbi:MAG: family 78 glycoside hydrolase catalytic domain [Opitutaceae bacterium]|nr:family 78 glycoside hydrolase catalytic domain [Opitutaceae bacterium]